MKNNYSAYNKLCTEFYDIDKPVAPTAEIAFYTQQLQSLPSVLEAMCGSGRLLIPLAQAGISIEGVDCSDAMLASCKQRAQQLGINPILYQQDLKHLNLNKTYDAIIIAVGSFQLIHDKKEALLIVQALKRHLNPGGFLLLDMFIPWDFITRKQEKYVDTRKVNCHDGSSIILTSHGLFNLEQQLLTDHTIYEKIIPVHLECRAQRGVSRDETPFDTSSFAKASEDTQGERCHDKIIETEHEDICITWYYHHEMELFLQKAGFNHIESCAISFKEGDSSMIYKARINY